VKHKYRYIDGPYRACNKKALRIFIVTILLILVCGLIAILYINHVMSAQDQGVYVVQEGDTLWGICKRIYGEIHDTREMVWKMRKLNGIEDPGQLQPGMRLVLPIIVD